MSDSICSASSALSVDDLVERIRICLKKIGHLDSRLNRQLTEWRRHWEALRFLEHEGADTRLHLRDLWALLDELLRDLEDEKRDALVERPEVGSGQLLE